MKKMLISAPIPIPTRLSVDPYFQNLIKKYMLLAMYVSRITPYVRMFLCAKLECFTMQLITSINAIANISSKSGCKCTGSNDRKSRQN